MTWDCDLLKILIVSGKNSIFDFKIRALHLNQGNCETKMAELIWFWLIFPIDRVA